MIALFAIAYLLAAVGANLAVAEFGKAAVVPVAFLAIGFDLTARDALHEAWHGKGLLWKMGGLILVGSLISYGLNRDSLIVGLASLAAFSLSAIADTLAYSFLFHREKMVKVNGSNVAGALVDSIVFPTIAFQAFLPGMIGAQLLAKMAGGFAWSFILSRTLWRRK